MADDVMRWSVTYTKQIKQKRKLYQDGFLELQSFSHKVKLYDDCDKLLESKIVKLDDAVSSGETLTFGAYLVDIGDPLGESKPIPNPILQRDKAMADRDDTLNNKTSKGSLHFSKPSSINLSPSQKIIREFKRREVQKYSSSPSCQDTMKADSTEWQVLYTTQLTQKAKKFHDGILKVGISGLRGKQVVLYDETGRQLGSRFLKNKEIIKVGESLKFDGHIVDIVELKDTNVDGSNCYTQNTVQSKINNEHLSEFTKCETDTSSAATSCPYTEKTNITEWDVMYTLQVTQMAKKYHDGVLKLASSALHGRQDATLLAEDGTVLSHRYLKLSEKINSGSSFNMTNYLVEVGEPRKHSEGECPRKASITENETPNIRRFDVDNINLCKRIPATKPLSNGEPPKRASKLQDKVISTTISNSKPLSDEWDVMYTTQVTQKAKKYHDGVLKLASSGTHGRQEVTLFADDGSVLTRRYLKLSEVINRGSSFNMTNYLVEVGESRKCFKGECPRKNSTSENETPENRSFEVDNIKLCKRIPANKPLSNGKPPKRASSLQDTDSKATDSVADKVISTTINQSKPLRDASLILSFLKKPSTQESVSIEKVHVKELFPSQASETFCESTRVIDAGGHCEVMASKATSTSNTNEQAKEIKDQSEISVDSMAIDSSMRDVSIDGRKGFESTKSRNEDFPCFDLGFD